MVVNLYTKFEVSILNSRGDIFGKKIWKERKRKRRTNGRMPICNLTIQLVVANLYKFEVSILNDCGDIFDKKSGEKKKNKYSKEQIGEGPFSIPRCNLSWEPVYQI